MANSEVEKILFELSQGLITSGVNVREALEEAILDENFVGEVVNIEGDFGETCTIRII